MAYHIRKAAVIGSGVMGSGIAAHLANIGIPTLLLDIVPRELTQEEETKGTFTVIEKGAEIGDGAVVEAQVFIGEGCKVGARRWGCNGLPDLFPGVLRE